MTDSNSDDQYTYYLGGPILFYINYFHIYTLTGSSISKK